MSRRRCCCIGCTSISCTGDWVVDLGATGLTNSDCASGCDGIKNTYVLADATTSICAYTPSACTAPDGTLCKTWIYSYAVCTYAGSSITLHFCLGLYLRGTGEWYFALTITFVRAGCSSCGYATAIFTSDTSTSSNCDDLISGGHITLTKQCQSNTSCCSLLFGGQAHYTWCVGNYADTITISRP